MICAPPAITTFRFSAVAPRSNSAFKKAVIPVSANIKGAFAGLVPLVLVEQNFYMASSVGDDFFILDDGRVVHSGRVEELVQNEELQSRYLGISKIED